jgi:hypothetical protein
MALSKRITKMTKSQKISKAVQSLIVWERIHAEDIVTGKEDRKVSREAIKQYREELKELGINL